MKILKEEAKIIDNFSYRLIIIATLAITFKSNFGIEFYGLEYEDSYSFVLSARQFAEGIYSSSFLVDGVSVGSIDTPASISTYGGHFITYPIFLSNFFRFFGYSATCLFWAQLFTAFLTMIILSLFSKDKKRWIIAPIVYCLAPIINVFGTTGLSETFSSFICVTFLFCLLKNKNLSYILISLFLALMCKRENLALLIVPLNIFIYRCIVSRKLVINWTIFKQIGLYILTITLYLLYIQNVFEIETIESEDISASTFSYSYFLRLFPIFIKAFFDFTLFNIAFYLFVFACSVSIIKKNISREQIGVLSLFLLYLLLYTFHYRGYGFVHGLEDDTEFSSFRYINNFYFTIPIFLCYSRATITCKQVKVFIWIALSILATHSLYTTMSLRKQYNKIEWENRFSEVQEVENIISNDSKKYVVISDNILLYQITQPTSYNVCNIQSIDLINKISKDYDCYLIIDDFNYYFKRYSIEIDRGRLRNICQIKNGKTIYQYR